MRLVDDHARNVALRDMRGFMREHAGELVLVGGREEQPAVDRDEATRHGEGIDLRVAHDEVGELVLAFLSATREPMSDVLQVLGDLGVLENEP